jgi:hypothetical protein
VSFPCLQRMSLLRIVGVPVAVALGAYEGRTGHVDVAISQCRVNSDRLLTEAFACT